MAPQEILQYGRSRPGASQWRSLAISLALIACTSSATLPRHGDDAMSLAVKGHGEAEVVHGKQISVIRREPSLSQDDTERRSKHGSRLQRVGKHLIHRHQSATRSGYSLWANVSGFAPSGGLCGHTGTEKYEAHLQGSEQAQDLENCMTHCESTPWCSTMSFHGDPMQNTGSNVCVVVSFPCTPVEGKLATDDHGAPIPNATDDKWITMNYTDWTQVFDSAKKQHCKMLPTDHETKSNVNSLEDCLSLCEKAYKDSVHWCLIASYKNANNKCDLMKQCLPEADTILDAGGFGVFKRGDRDTVAHMEGSEDETDATGNGGGSEEDTAEGPAL